MTGRARGTRRDVESIETGFISRITLKLRHDGARGHPLSIPAVAALVQGLCLHARATFLVGENGTGKSTLVEAIAVAAGFNPEGGTQNFRFSTRSSESQLHQLLRLSRTARRPLNGFFLRAESLFNVATNIEDMDSVPALARPVIDSYGGRSLHEQSHGESFLALVQHRFGPNGLYFLDEPESALSPSGQLTLLRCIHELAECGSQFVIATHSPLLMALPKARIYLLSDRGIEEVEYQETEHYDLTKSFLNSPEDFLRKLLE